LKKIVSFFILHSSFFIAPSAHAVPLCPVCTVGVGAGLEAARLLGVDDAITGVWAGALVLMLSLWTIKFLKRRGVENGLWYLAVLASYYALLGGVYFLPGIEFGADTLLGADKFLLGAILGTIAFYIAEYRLNISLRNNGGKSRYKFQKVIVPMGALLALSGILAAIVYI
jgi:hypothetical protein